MQNQYVFVKLLKPIKRQLIVENLAKEFQILLLLVGIGYFFWMTISRVLIIAAVLQYMLLTFAIIILIWGVRIGRTSPSEKNAVLVMNHYVGDDRVSSAYSFMSKNGVVEQLLLRDAIDHMEKQLPTALKRKRRWIYPKFLIIALICIIFGTLSFLFPNSIMEAGIEKGKEEKVVSELKKDLEKAIDDIENGADKKVLEKRLDELMETKTTEEFLESLQKAYKEIELAEQKESLKQLDLKKIQESLEKKGFQELAEAIKNRDNEKIQAVISELSKRFNVLTEQEKNDLAEIIGTENLGINEIEGLSEKISQSIESERISESLNVAQRFLQNQATKLNEKLQSLDLPPIDVAFSPESRQNGPPNQSGEPSNGNQGNNESPGQGEEGTGNQPSNNGIGQNNGAGQNGTTSGGSQGNGNSGEGQRGNGSGNQGGGTSAGLGPGSRQFLTVPETLDTGFNLEKDFGKLGEGQQGTERESDGFVSKGNLRPYEEVYSEYEQAYLKGLDRVNLPSDLESIIKNYFSRVKP